jgi:hypothetical protein
MLFKFLVADPDPESVAILTLDPGWKNLDPQHWQIYFYSQEAEKILARLAAEARPQHQGERSLGASARVYRAETRRGNCARSSHHVRASHPAFRHCCRQVWQYGILMR